jgi:hypothetical protein
MLLTLLFKWNRISNILEWFEKFQKITKSKPNQIDFRKKGDYSLYIRTNLIIMIELLWILAGLFTNNWFIFLSVIIYSIISRLAINRIRWTLLGKTLSYTFLITRIVIYSFVILNHFNYFFNSSLSSFN